MNSQVGAPRVHINAIVANSIPGYATYFWVVPGRNVIASVRFVHTVSGQRPMREYVERFLATESPYVVSAQNGDGEDVIAGYAQDGRNIERVLYPKFRTVAFVKRGRSEYVINNYARIKRVIRRGHLTVANAVDRRAWEGFIGFLRGRRPGQNQVVVDKSAYVELEYTPSQAELREMIAAETEADESGPWDDMGFKLQGEKQVYWLGRSTASDTFLLPIERINEEIVDLNQLAETLNDHRARILRLLDDHV